MPTFPKNFHGKSIRKLCAKLLTDRQTDKQRRKYNVLGGSNDAKYTELGDATTYSRFRTLYISKVNWTIGCWKSRGCAPVLPHSWRRDAMVRHEVCRFPTLIPKRQSLDLLELSTIFLSPWFTPFGEGHPSHNPHTSAYFTPRIVHPTFQTWRRGCILFQTAIPS